MNTLNEREQKIRSKYTVGRYGELHKGGKPLYGDALTSAMHTLPNRVKRSILHEQMISMMQSGVNKRVIQSLEESIKRLDERSSDMGNTTSEPTQSYEDYVEEVVDGMNYDQLKELGGYVNALKVMADKLQPQYDADVARKALQARIDTDPEYMMGLSPEERLNTAYKLGSK